MSGGSEEEPSSRKSASVVPWLTHRIANYVDSCKTLQTQRHNFFSNLTSLLFLFWNIQREGTVRTVAYSGGPFLKLLSYTQQCFGHSLFVGLKPKSQHILKYMTLDDDVCQLSCCLELDEYNHPKLDFFIRSVYRTSQQEKSLVKNNFILLLNYLPGQHDFSPCYLFSNMGERYTTELEVRSSKHTRLVYFNYVQVIITNILKCIQERCMW